MLYATIRTVIVASLLTACGSETQTTSTLTDINHQGLLNGDLLGITESRSFADATVDGKHFRLPANGEGGIDWSWIRYLTLNHTQLPATSALGVVADLSTRGRGTGPAVDLPAGSIAEFRIDGSAKILPAGSIPAGNYQLTANLRAAVRPYYHPLSLALSRPTPKQTYVTVSFHCSGDKYWSSKSGSQSYTHTSARFEVAEASIVTQPIDLATKCGGSALYVTFGASDALGFQFLDASVSLSRVN